MLCSKRTARAGTATVTASSGTVGTDSTIKVDVAIGATTLNADFDATIGDSLTVAFVDKSTGNPTNWEWDFGDGERSAVREPAHTYAAAGSYVVVLRVRGVDGEDSQSKRITVPSSQATPPVAMFSVASSGLLATFTDMSTGTIASWDWSFGDGARSTVRSPTHAYQAAGIYTVALTVRNAAGESTTSKSVTVPTSQLPDADFDYQETTGLRVLFRDKSTNVPTHWSWDFGDGATSHDANPTHPYSQTGTYTVALTASNLAGSSTETKFVVVRGPLVADFRSQVNGLTVSFTDLSSGQPATFEWNFGDGSAKATDRNPVHTYVTAKTYTVTLVVTRIVSGGSTSEQASKSAPVVVNAP